MYVCIYLSMHTHTYLYMYQPRQIRNLASANLEQLAATMDPVALLPPLTSALDFGTPSYSFIYIHIYIYTYMYVCMYVCMYVII